MKIKKLTKPKEPEATLFYEQIENLTHNHYDAGDGSPYDHSWESSYDCRLGSFASFDNDKMPNKLNTQSIGVSQDILDCKFVYAVTVTYSSGDTFGRSSGNMAVAAIVSSVEKANEIKGFIEKGKGDFYREYGKYAAWEGYFERVQDVNIVVLSIF